MMTNDRDTARSASIKQFHASQVQPPEILHRDGNRFVVRTDDKLTAFLELKTAVCQSSASDSKSKNNIPTTSQNRLVYVSSATLNGSLNPHGLTTTGRFQYGTITSYGHITAMQSQTGNTYRNIAANISGLTTHTTYHFRIAASNSAGTRYGGDRTFTTR